MKVTGTVFKIFPVQQVSDRFKKREFVLEYAENPEYPQFVLFQTTQDRTSLLDNYTEGQSVEVNFNLRGREWISPRGEKKYFNSIEAWRINPAESGSEGAGDKVETAEVISGDDLPF